MLKIIRTAKDGERLQELDKIRPIKTPLDGRLLFVDEKRTYQTHAGFGGALTEATTANLQLMSKAQYDEVLQAYYGAEGLRYNLGRLTINSSDFGYGNYDYLQGEDASLKSFSLAKEQTRCLPVLKDIFKLRGERLKLMASPWSPPAFMKTNKMMNHGGKLLKEHYQTWADYLSLYLEEMAKAGIKIDFITVQNEPEATQTWESCLYTAEEEAIFIRDYLGPTLKKKHLETKIFIWDHNRDEIVRRAYLTLRDPKVAEYVYGIAFHWYVSDAHHHLSYVHHLFPDKHLFFTEGCVEMRNRNLPLKNMMGAWKNGETYGRNIINDFNNYNEAFIDWNLVLDEQGGPNHVENFCEAPIVFDRNQKALIYNPSFYFIAHFSKYIEVGAKRLAIMHDVEQGLHACAYLNPDQKIVIVIQNETNQTINLCLKLRGQYYPLKLKRRSISTLKEE
ncbi:MAG: glycoside hydrolase family 30 protein [Bacilli bacterium]